MKQVIRTFLALAAVGVALSGCFAPNVPGVYRVDVQQGNIVTEDMLKRLEPGMTRRKVRFVLGTPLLFDTFNDDRWDYLYTFQRGTSQRVQRRVSVLFDGDLLKRIEGDVEPAVRREPPPRRNDQVVDVVGPGEPHGVLSAFNPFSDELEDENDGSFWDTITGSEKKLPRGVRRAKPKGVTKAAPPKAAGSASTTATEATVRTVPADPNDDGQPLPPPTAAQTEDAQTGDADTKSKSSFLQRLTGDKKNADSQETPSDAAQTQAAAAADEETQSPSLWKRLSNAVSSDDEAEAPVAPSASNQTAPSGDAPAPSVEPTTSASTTSASTTSAEPPASSTRAKVAEPKPIDALEDGGSLFSRIRERFKLPDTIDGSSLIEVTPPEEDITGDR
jgi:outer membrane protein assembly factor BamE